MTTDIVEVSFDKVYEPFYIGENVQYKVVDNEIPEKYLEDNYLFGEVVYYKHDLHFPENDIICIRAEFFLEKDQNNDDIYDFKFFEIPHKYWINLLGICE